MTFDLLPLLRPQGFQRFADSFLSIKPKNATQTVSVLVILLIGFISDSHGQSVSCSELIEFAETELGYGSTVNTFNSDWIQKVSFYSHENTYVAIASIKESEYNSMIPTLFETNESVLAFNNY